MNKFILNFELLEKNNLSVNQFLNLLSIYDERIDCFSNVCLNSLQNDGYIKIIQLEIGKQYILREKGKEFIESCIYKEKDLKWVDTLVKECKEEVDFEEFVKQYRNLWKGLKVGSQGNPKSVEDKLKRWMKENPDYTQDDILRAARTYINSLEDFKYLQKADYFIYKKDKFGEQSRLSDFIDEDEIIESGWGSELK